MTVKKKAYSPDLKTTSPEPEAPPKPGYYDCVLDEAEKLDFEAASEVDGIDDEIALLRMRIKKMMEDKKANLRDILAAENMLAKLVKIRYSMNKKQEKSLGEAIHNIIKDIGVPLGTAVLNKKL